MARYLVKTGLTYGPTSKRAEPGDVVDDLPGEDIRHLLNRGAIAPDIGSLTKAELVDRAESLGLEIPSTATKAEILGVVAQHVSGPEVSPPTPEDEPGPDTESELDEDED